MRHRWRPYILPLMVILVAAGIIFLTPGWNICSWDFRNCLWGPVHMLVSGQPPYSQNTPYGPFPASWLPMAMGAFFYLGWLPCQAASKIWFLVEMASLGTMIWLLSGRALPAPRMFLLSLLAVALFPPLYLHFKNGQFTLLFILLLMVSFFLPHSASRTPWWKPLLLAVGLTKPQLGFLIYPGILIAEYRQGGWRGAIDLVWKTAACAALLTVPLFIVRPAWPMDLANLLFGYAASPWATPSLYAQLPRMLGPVGKIIWAVAFLAAAGLVVFLWWRLDSRKALVWTMALTPMVLPYTWSYDFVLLLPALIMLLLSFRGTFSRVVLLGGALLVDFAIVAFRWRNDLGDGFHWWVPPAMLGIFLLALLLEQKTHSLPRDYLEEPSGRAARI